MDAFTAKEHTCFYVGVLDEHLPLAVDLLSDILMRPLFAAEDIEKEKAVVLQEIKMVEDTPDDLIHDLFAEQVWAGPSARPPHPRPLGAREGVRPGDHPPALRGGVRPRAHHGGGGRSRGARAGARPLRLALRGLRAPRRRPGTGAPPTLHPGHPHGAPSRSSRCTSCWAFPASPTSPPSATRCTSSTTCIGGQHVLPPLPGDARAPGARVLRALGHPGLPGHRRPLRLRGHGAGELRQGARGGA